MANGLVDLDFHSLAILGRRVNPLPRVQTVGDHLAVAGEGAGVRVGYDGRMAKILIVDDDADTRESLATIFRAHGHVVACVPNGREALAHTLADLPDVVLLDMLMPEMDGPSFLEVIRSYLRIQSLSVVVLTGLGDSPMIDRARAMKVNTILAKGKATPDDIVKAVEEAVARLPG